MGAGTLDHTFLRQSSSFNLGAKATGQKFTKRIAGPAQAKEVPKGRQPDWSVRDKTTPEQAVLYRLSGDYNGLHIGKFVSRRASRSFPIPLQTPQSAKRQVLVESSSMDCQHLASQLVLSSLLLAVAIRSL